MSTTKVAGSFIFIMILLSIAASVYPAISPLAGAVLAWLASFILICQLPRAMLIQIGLMLLVGLGCQFWSLDNLSQLPLLSMLSVNHKLLSLITAVSFLRLVTQPDVSGSSRLPSGKIAVLKTLWGVHLFSAVISISAMIIFGNRIEKAATINRLHAIMFSRSFACACFWSPFYVAIATALLYAPGSELLVLSLAGLPIAVFGLALTSWQFMQDKEIETTAGFPLHMDSLSSPIILSMLMILAHLILPDFPVLTLITLLSLLLTFIILLYRKPTQVLSLFRDHIYTELPRMNRELSLFLAVGVMSTGLTVLIADNAISLSLSEFTPLTGGAFILGSIFVSILGVHPIITISVIGSLLSGTSFNPNLLGICMMMMWGLGIVISPLSGINLAIQGRFGLSSFSLLRWNAAYVAGMLIFCTALLYFYSATNLL